MGASEPFDIVTWLRASGLTVTLDAECLVVRPAECLTDELRGAIRAHRIEIIRLLEAEWNDVIRLLWQCGEGYGFTELEHAEALAAALADRDGATRCFRTIAEELSNT